jgi:DNA mismatch endonuclease (patch repair protein)
VGYRCDVADLPGRPDIVFRRCRVAVFVDGGLWHGHPERYWPGRSSPYWDAKIARNIERDIINARRLREVGWTVLRFWDTEILKDQKRVVQAIVAALADSGYSATAFASPSSLLIAAMG